MFRDTETLLEYEAGKKPLVADLVARAIELTDDEINAAAVLPWIKIAVRQRRDALLEEEQRKAIMAALELAEHRNRGAFLNGVTPDPEGTAYYWSGDQEWVRVNARGGMIQVRYSDLVWLPDAGGAWIDTIWVRDPPQSFVQRLVMVQRTSMTGYARLRQERLQKHYLGDNLPIMDLTGEKSSEPMTRLGSLGVRIAKP